MYILAAMEKRKKHIFFEDKQPSEPISCVFYSVADPDPVGSGLFGSPGCGPGKIPDPDPLFTKSPL